MATEAALSLITNIASLKQGLELGFVVLLIHNASNYTQPNCDDITSNISSNNLAIIGTSSALIAALLILVIVLLIIIVFVRYVKMNCVHRATYRIIASMNICKLSSVNIYNAFLL